MKKVELGYVELSEKAVVSDPCYDRDTWCMERDLPILPGRYQAVVVYGDEAEFGTRVASIVLMHEKYQKARNKAWRTISSNIGVDSGQCGIFDDTIYPQSQNHPDNEPPFYGECCSLTLGKDQVGILSNGKGIVSSSGYGDGCYKLSAVSDDGKYVALMVDYQLLKRRGIMLALLGIDPQKDGESSEQTGEK